MPQQSERKSMLWEVQQNERQIERGKILRKIG